MTKVFLSSIITGMEEMRAAAEAACAGLDLPCLKAEPLPASPSSPQGACLQLVRDADGVILLLGRRYGTAQRSGKSATEEEFDEAARLGKSVFVFITAGELDADQERFRKRLGEWQGGQLYKALRSTTELQREVTRALRSWSSSPPTGETDSVVKQNLAAVFPPAHPNTFGSGGPWVAVSWRPSQMLHLDDAFVFDKVPAIAGDLFVVGDHRLSDQRPQSIAKQDGLEFRVREANRAPSLAAWIGLDAAVAVGVEIRPASVGNASHNSSFFLPPRELERTLGRCFAFVRAFLEHVDPDRVVNSGRLQAGLSRMGMKHLAEPTHGSVTVPRRVMTGDDKPTILPKEPETVVRPKLTASGDLVALYLSRFQRAFGEDQLRSTW